MKFPEWLKVYGDTGYRGPCRKEDAEQIDLFSHLPDDVRVLAIHPKNEGKRTWGQVHFDRITGSLSKGASDLIIPGSPAFVCELKRLDHTKSRWKKGQVEYLEAAHHAGCFACVALGYEAALKALEDWKKVVDGQ